MAKGKIVHIAFSGLGGTNEYINSLILGDSTRKYEHIVVFYGVEMLEDEAYNFIQDISSAVYFIKKQRGIDRNAISQLKNRLAELSPFATICHVNSLIIHLAKSKTGKLIFVEHQANHLKQRKEWIWSLVAQKKADVIVSFTENYLVELKRKLKMFFRKDKNVVINTGVHLSDFRQDNKKEKEFIKIGITSRINHFRDHESLVKGFIELGKDAKAELFIAGEGPLKEHLEKKYQSSNIKWLGSLNRDQIISLLKELDIYVIASFGESTSIALMQAQAAGLAVIGSDVDGVNHVLNTENSILVQAGNAEDYQNALDRLIKDEVLRIRLSEASSTYANAQLDCEIMFESFEKLLQ
jgi:glycosyltransferase involved in cell wall biosynthesis